MKVDSLHADSESKFMTRNHGQLNRRASEEVRSCGWNRASGFCEWGLIGLHAMTISRQGVVGTRSRAIRAHPSNEDCKAKTSPDRARKRPLGCATPDRAGVRPYRNLASPGSTRTEDNLGIIDSGRILPREPWRLDARVYRLLMDRALRSIPARLTILQAPRLLPSSAAGAPWKCRPF